MQWLWRHSLQVALVLGVTACGATVAQRPPAPGAAEMQGGQGPASFIFTPPQGTTTFSWTVQRSFEATIARTRVADRNQSELRWDVSMHPSQNDTTVVDERLVGVSFEHDGRTVVSGKPDALIHLVFDSEGTLEAVSGIDAASRAVRALASPGMEATVGRTFSPQALDALVRSRAQLLIGDVVGRPTAEGATWIVASRPGDNALFTRYTVGGTKSCYVMPPQGGPAECAQLHVWVDVQPRVAEDAATALVERHTRQPVQGVAGPPEGGHARYVMWGTVLVQPATLLPAGATLREDGHITLLSGRKSYRVNLAARSEDHFEYGARGLAAR
ncbi:MAG TPA: hypothetical protein VF765_06405 [Polyangiaceae bacterium]